MFYLDQLLFINFFLQNDISSMKKLLVMNCEVNLPFFFQPCSFDAESSTGHHIMEWLLGGEELCLLKSTGMVMLTVNLTGSRIMIVTNL